MKYVVKGADRKTGEDIELTFDAPDDASAREKANRRGVLVASCISAEDNNRADDGAAQPNRPSNNNTPPDSILICPPANDAPHQTPAG